jgi:hypothetical protein
MVAPHRGHLSTLASLPMVLELESPPINDPKLLKRLLIGFA